MSYTALARKWRPRRFEELTGQEHVLQALSNALATNRVHHAFLFTGTRGVGKTTIARILAKCLNCETGLGPTPCGECATCREIDEGRFVDLIEVDAASRTKVDDTRELLDNVQYAPTRGRYKVYLIDEVHMLSTHSFNALLKTLEEPPPHVKFLLATTDPQKLPVTVLSRCLQFNLKRLSVSLIAERIKTVLDAEGVPYDAAAVRLVAEAADGSMRDGLSLLDQLLAFGGGKVAEAEARTMLATVDRKQVAQLARLLAQLEPAALLEFVASLDEWAPDYGDVLDALATLLVRVALKQTMPAYEGDELHPVELLAELAAQLSPEDVQLFYQTAILGRRDLVWAPDPRTGFEMTVLRMIAFRPNATPEGSAAAAVPAQVRVGAATPRSTAASPIASAPSSANGVPQSSASAVAPEGASAAPGVDPARWAETLAALEVGGAARQLAANCVFSSRSGNLVRLTLDPSQSLLRTSALIDKLAQALSRHLGESLRVEVELGSSPVDSPARAEQRAVSEGLDAARRTLEDDSTVRGFKEKFGATLNPDSVKPV
ncbi:MAG: DNA polymerase III subunit gamma/tau [Sinobacteraceae bacterium]|nr:DNA polymerase III subunit gamma/tau [Nevskiaceae bacterium]